MFYVCFYKTNKFDNLDDLNAFLTYLHIFAAWSTVGYIMIIIFLLNGQWTFLENPWEFIVNRLYRITKTEFKICYLYIPLSSSFEE